MKKQLLCSAVVALMLGTSGSVWAEPHESEVHSKDVSKVVSNETLTPKETGLEQIQRSDPNSLDGQSETVKVHQDVAQVPYVGGENKQNQLLPTILGGTGILLALFSLIYSWRKAGQMASSKQELINEMKRLLRLKEKLEKDINSLQENFKQYQDASNSVINTLLEEIKQLRKLSPEEKVNITPVESKLLVNEEFIVNPTITSVAQVAPIIEVTDAEIIEKISLAINDVLQMSTQKFKPNDFKAILDGLSKDDLNIHSYRLLQNDLESESSRGFDAIVIFLNKALSSGTNTLIYLQNNVAQHSAISWIFENARDGMVISEMLEPAQLKQIHFNELAFKEENIIQKGKVAEG